MDRVLNFGQDRLHFISEEAIHLVFRLHLLALPEGCCNNIKYLKNTVVGGAYLTGLFLAVWTHVQGFGFTAWPAVEGEACAHEGEHDVLEHLPHPEGSLEEKMRSFVFPDSFLQLALEQIQRPLLSQM